MPDDYEIGYRRPPQATQFKSGASGNPKGRPKGSKNLKTDLMEELQEKVRVTEGTREKVVSKQRAFVKSMTSRALKGDARAINTLSNLILSLLPQEDEGPPQGQWQAMTRPFSRPSQIISGTTIKSRPAETGHRSHKI